MLLLSEQYLGMMELLLDHRGFDAEGWDRWRTMLRVTLGRLWRQQAAIAAIRTKYYDDRQVLFAHEAADLNLRIKQAESLVGCYNTCKSLVPSSKAIDLAALRCSTKPYARAEVCDLVDRAKAEMLFAFGEVEAARRIVRAHLRQSSARFLHPPG
jgi:hypothetical protein